MIHLAAHGSHHDLIGIGIWSDVDMNSGFWRAVIIFLSSISFVALAQVKSELDASSHLIPLSEIQLRVYFEIGMTPENDVERNEICEKWLKAFAPGTGPWGYGVAAKGGCVFKLSAQEGVEELSHSKIFLFIRKDIDESHPFKFEICWPKLSAVRARAVGNLKESLKCPEALSVPASINVDMITRDERFMQWVAAQLMEASPLFAQSKVAVRATTSDSRQTRPPEESQGFLPSPPQGFLAAEIQYEIDAAKYVLKPVAEGADKKTDGNNIWLILRPMTPERRKKYAEKIDSFKPSLKRTQVGSVRTANPTFQTGLIFSQGLQISSLKSEYALSATTTFFYAPQTEGQLGFHWKKSRYSLNIGQNLELKKFANSNFVVQFDSSALWVIPIRIVFPAPAKNSLFSVSFAPVYMFDNRKNTLLSEGLDADTIGIESLRHHFAGIESALGLRILEGLRMSLTGAFNRDVKDKVTDLSTSVEATWFNNPTTPREGFYLGLFLRYDSVERLLRLSVGSSRAQLSAVLNSLHTGLKFGVGF